MTRRLPPLNAVRAFEAASRHLNLSRAAEELGVTQGAISKHVIALEDFIGAQLFERTPTGLALTTEGHALRGGLRPAFELMEDAFARYSRRPPRSSAFRIATLASVASQFLAPRLDAFRERFPDLELEILTSTRVVDLAREEVDLSIRHGHGNWDDVISTPLTQGRLIPVCAPRLFDAAGGSPQALLAANRRIQTNTANEWRPWAEAAGLDVDDPRPPFVMEDFLVAIKVAITGQGLLLLHEILLHDPIAHGLLVQFSPVAIPSEASFHIVRTPAAARRPIVEEVAAWLAEEGAGPA